MDNVDVESLYDDICPPTPEELLRRASLHASTTPHSTQDSHGAQCTMPSTVKKVKNVPKIKGVRGFSDLKRRPTYAIMVVRTLKTFEQDRDQGEDQGQDQSDIGVSTHDLEERVYEYYFTKSDGTVDGSVSRSAFAKRFQDALQKCVLAGSVVKHADSTLSCSLAS